MRNPLKINNLKRSVLIEDCLGTEMNELKNLLVGKKIFDYNIVMFRDIKFWDRYEYISIQLSIPVVEPGGNANQTKNGYTFFNK